jgi:hypothetical protein
MITIVPKLLIDDHGVAKELSKRGTPIEQVHKYK